jgi:hypothetical protein
MRLLTAFQVPFFGPQTLKRQRIKLKTGVGLR